MHSVYQVAVVTLLDQVCRQQMLRNGHQCVTVGRGAWVFHPPAARLPTSVMTPVVRVGVILEPRRTALCRPHPRLAARSAHQELATGVGGPHTRVTALGSPLLSLWVAEDRTLRIPLCCKVREPPSA